MKVYDYENGSDVIKYVRLSELKENVRQLFLGWSQNQTSPIVELEGCEYGDAIAYEDFRRFIHETVPG